MLSADSIRSLQSTQKNLNEAKVMAARVMKWANGDVHTLFHGSWVPNFLWFVRFFRLGATVPRLSLVTKKWKLCLFETESAACMVDST
jgi:hypothetical protein